MTLKLGLGIKFGRLRRKKASPEPPTPGEAFYLLTAAGNRILTAKGTRIKLVASE